MQLRRSVEIAIRKGCHGILSFGIAGGLAPHLKPGSCVVARNIIADSGRYASDSGWAQSLMGMFQEATPRRAALRDVSFGDIAGSDVPLSSAHAKRKLHEKTGAVAVDTESHVAARIAAEHRIPFAAFRVITDPSDRALPPAAMVATRSLARSLGSPICASIFSTWRENTYWAGRCRSSGISGAIGPSVRTPFI